MLWLSQVFGILKIADMLEKVQVSPEKLYPNILYRGLIKNVP
jgi:hypothetical protein